MNKNKLLTPIKITVFLKDSFHSEKVYESYPIIIGRSKKCDLILSDFEFLSRQHCVVNFDEDVLQILDLESANGIFFQNQKIKSVPLTKTTEVTVGDLRLKLEVLPALELHSHSVADAVEAAPPEPVIEKQTPKDLPSLGNIVSPTAKSKVLKVEKPLKEKTQTKTGTQETMKTATAGRNLEHPLREPVIPKQKPAELPKHEHMPMRAHSVDNHGGLSLIKPHHHANQLRPNQRVLEGFVTWKDQIYESHQFYAGSQVVVGLGEEANIQIPTLKFALPLAFYDGNATQCVIPQSLDFSIQSETGFIEKQELLNTGKISAKNNNVSFKMGPCDVVSVKVGTNVAVHFRYAPAPRQLTKTISLLGDAEIRKAAIGSGIVHLGLLLAILFTEPKSKAPVIKNVPERYARLLVKKPTPPPPPKIEPPKPKEKVVAKREEPKPRVEPKKKQTKQVKVVKLQQSKILKRVNKYPVEVDQPMKPAEKPVVANIQAVGALAALNAFSKSAPTDQPVAVNINKNAGGQTALNTGGVIGALKTNSGKLAAGGLASVKTKGLGYGTGTGYGVQGIKGTAGGRSVAGTVVGAPSLMRLSKEDGLTRAQVMEVVKRYMTDIQQCYERSLIDNPSIAGRAEYEWEITPKGGVVWAKVKKSEMSGADSLNNCVSGVFKKMKFPVAKNGQNTIPNIGFPFGRL